MALVLPPGKFAKKTPIKAKPFKIHEGSVRKEFEKLHEDGKPLLTTDNKYIVFGGLLELTDRSCVHMELKNPTKFTILFNIRTPTSPVFFVKPHVGMIEPDQKVTLYFTFRGKCQKVPSDYCWIYSIYHIKIDEKDTKQILEDEFSTTKLREVWNEKGRGDIDNILHLSCRFDESSEGVKCTNKAHRPKRHIYVDEKGDVLEAGPIEESRERPNTPQGRSTEKKPASSAATTDELPKTASGTSEKRK